MPQAVGVILTTDNSDVFCTAVVRALFCVFFLLSTMLGSASPGFAQSQEEKHTISIPSLNAAEALNMLAEQTGAYLLFPYAEAAARQANPVHGVYTLSDGLKVLLAGTGLRGSLSESGVVNISVGGSDNEIDLGSSAMRQNKTGVLASIASLFLGLGSSTTTAQEEPEQHQESYRQIEEIIVTATRREKGIQETAMSISALSGDMLEKTGNVSIGRILDSVPGVTSISSGPNDNRVIIRNIATSTQESGSATSATYFDDFNVSSMLATSPEIRLVDMERVEVLKGPQGTLFGRSAMGGIVRYISNKPDFEAMSGGINTYVSNTTDGGDNYGGHGYLNAPLSDTLALRAVGFSYQNDGFIDNVELDKENFNDEDTVGGRLALRWQPTDALTVDFTYINQDVDGAPNWATTIHTEEGDLPYDVEDREQNFGILMEQSADHEIYNLTTTYEFDSFSATFLATISDESNSIVFDQREYLGLTSGCVCDFLDSGNSNVMDNEIYELRFVSNTEGNLDWILGAYYQESERVSERLIRYYGATTPVFGGALEFNDGDILQDWAEEANDKETAVYGEFGYSFSDATRLALGYRRSDVEYDNTTLKAQGLFDFINGTDQIVGIKFDTQEDVDTYRISLEHSMNDDLFVYATASSGYRRGGFNLPTLIAPFSTYDSDSLWNYELGAKSTWLDGRLVANVSAYMLLWDDIQLTVQDPVTFVRATQNVGEVEIPGIEFSLVYQLTDTLDVSFAGSLSSPELQEDVPGGVSGKKGDSLPGSAEENFSVVANWRKPIRNGFELFSTLNYTYVGSRLNDFNEDLDVELDSYQLVDLRAGVSSERGYSVSLFADNVFDEAIEYLVIHMGPSFDAVPTNRPRTVGVNLTWDF